MGKVPDVGLGGLPKRLRWARAASGLTGAQMAERLESAAGRAVAGSTITGWERGVSVPGLHFIECWAEITDVDLLWLTYGRVTASAVASPDGESDGSSTKWYVSPDQQVFPIAA